MNDLFFYPKLTDELKEACGLQVEKYSFSFYDNDTECELQQKGASTIKVSSDKYDYWKVEGYGINVSKTITIAYPHLLYGPNGVACSHASLGMCIMWTNKTLTQTGYILPYLNDETATGLTCRFEHSFEPSLIKGDLELSVILYIKESASEVLPGEAHLMNEAGVTVGEIETVVLDFNSIYMEFPIEEYSSPNEPLWWVEFSQWEDPKVDLFDRENLCLYLNPYYEACPVVGEEVKNFDLLVDIMASTYFLIFKKIDEDTDSLKATKEGIGLENNSICSIMHQFIESCSVPLHFESDEALLKSLNINIRTMLEEGDD